MDFRRRSLAMGEAGSGHLAVAAREGRRPSGPNISAPGLLAPEACWTLALALSFTHTSLKSPFHSPFLHSPCMLLSEFLRRSPPKVTFQRFSEMYLANYVAFCGMSVCVLLILYCFTGPRGSRANPGGSTKNRYFFHIDFLKVFSSCLHYFWITFSRFFHTFSITFSRPILECSFLDVSHFFDFLLLGRTLADTHSTAAR